MNYVLEQGNRWFLYSVKSAYRWLQSLKIVDQVDDMSRFQISSVCPFCKVYNETTYNCLVDCEFSWNCWLVTGLDVCRRYCESFYQWLKALVKWMSLDSIARVVMLCWSIWTARNDMVWNQRVDEVVSLATITLNQYIVAQNVGSISSLNPLRSGDGSCGRSKSNHISRCWYNA
ncbi:hypothetical protein POM88_054292 [Heracleum sosnowskyi]|uniref:Reverse transcriptase zinc-binding domain-containing protein n=1 Tax=Heracleum sosnowskyi TaxID=360622 RepID=A0AAD8GMH9_9APIA|nr:hypothetical protein POM88_054292 [Heracleum sosnowskyi]